MTYLLALGAVTTRIKAALFDKEGKVIALSERKTDISFPASGLGEQDPEQIYHVAIEAIKDTIQKAGFSCNQVTALGSTYQRINVIMWVVRTGKPVYNALGWQDQLGHDLKPSFIARQTVQYTRASLVVGKILWLNIKIPDLRSCIETGEAVLGGIDIWLLWKLTGGQAHTTDVSNAFLSRDTKARGSLIELTRSVQKGHIARAVLESLAVQVREAIDVMEPVIFGVCALTAVPQRIIFRYRF